MKKNKFQKGKSLAIAVFGLAAVAVVGVGFSSWVINFRNSDTIGTVNMSVANVEDKSIMIFDAKVSSPADKFNFDAAPADASGLNVSNGTNTAFDDEDGRTVTFEFVVGLYDASQMTNESVYMDFEQTNTGLTAYSTYVNTTGANQYLISPLAKVADTSIDDKTSGLAVLSVSHSGTTPTFDLASGAGDYGIALVNAALLSSTEGYTEALAAECPVNYLITMKMSFRWGSAFEGKNPATYYNGLENFNHNEALTTLRHLHELDGATFAVTLSTNTLPTA